MFLPCNSFLYKIINICHLRKLPGLIILDIVVLLNRKIMIIVTNVFVVEYSKKLSGGPRNISNFYSAPFR